MKSNSKDFQLLSDRFAEIKKVSEKTSTQFALAFKQVNDISNNPQPLCSTIAIPPTRSRNQETQHPFLLSSSYAARIVKGCPKPEMIYPMERTNPGTAANVVLSMSLTDECRFPADSYCPSG